MDVDDSCYAVDKTITWQAYSSCTTDPSVLAKFLGDAGQRGVVFVIECNQTGRDVSSLSSVPGEKEVNRIDHLARIQSRAKSPDREH